MSVFDFWVKELNQKSLRKYEKYTSIFGVGSLLLKLITKFPFFEIMMFGISVFFIIISVKALFDEKFRPLILNGNGAFENTKYILYFFIYTGVVGVLLTGWCLTSFFLSKFQ